MKTAPDGYEIITDTDYLITGSDLYRSGPFPWEPAKGVIGKRVRELFSSSRIAKPIKEIKIKNHDLALRIASTLQPQMSVDAKSGNRTARSGLEYLTKIVERELSGLKISSK